MRNFCVIDIGTNAVKVKIFSNGEYTILPNRNIGFVNGNISKEDILKHVKSFMLTAKRSYNVEHRSIYLYATEGVRSAPNGDEIKKELEAAAHRRLFVLNPRREARLSILGGLRSIRLKNNPKQVLFMESGGGSTEVSLLDMTKRPFSIIESVSLPVGSRNGKTPINQGSRINKFCTSILRKSVKLDPSLQIVINAGGASRIIAHSLNSEEYRPDLIAQNQNDISVEDFGKNCRQILKEDADNEDFQKKYFLNSENKDGFIGHVNVLDYILKNMQKHKLGLNENTPITTTIGGLKDGAAHELEEKFLREDAGNEKENPGTDEEKLNIADEYEENSEKDFSEDRTYAQPLRDFYKKVAKSEGSLYIEDKKSAHYKASLIRAEAGERLNISATNKNNVTMSAQTASGESKIPDYQDFENLVQYAKQQGRRVSFGNIKSSEFRARLFLACLENDVEMSNAPEFDFKEIENETAERIKRAQIKNSKVSKKMNPQQSLHIPTAFRQQQRA